MDNIIEQIDQYHEEHREKPRGHLGASQIGRECSRDIWYSFRWASPDQFSGRMLRLFRHGYTYEPIFISDLRKIGFKVITKNRKTGKDIGFKDLDGHFAGSVDGMAQKDGKWMLLEFKTHSDKSFTYLKKNGVLKAKPEHYGQMQVYMHYMKVKEAFYLAVNKNNDELYDETIEYNEDYALSLIEKAQFIIEGITPPSKLSVDPSYYKCKWCSHRNVCHGDTIPLVNCRTCEHSTPAEDGLWSCGMHEKMLSHEDQLKGCKDHAYIPATVKEVKEEIKSGEAPEGKQDYLEFLYESQKRLGARIDNEEIL